MVARKARQSYEQWNKCNVAAQNWSEHAGFGWFTPQNQY
jgi:hypothetical protein